MKGGLGVIAAAIWLAAGTLISGVAQADGPQDIVNCKAAIDARDFDRAIALCTRAIRSGELGPSDHVRALDDRADAYAGLDEIDKAIKDATAAIAIIPSSSNAFLARGRIYLAKRDDTLALDDLNQAVALDPSSTDALKVRAGIYGMREDYTATLMDLNKVIELKPDDEWALTGRGRVYTLIDRKAYPFPERYARAIESFDEVIKLKPDYADAYAARGWARALKGDYQKAIDDLNHSIMLDPKSASFAMRWKGLAQFNAGQFTDAAKTLETYDKRYDAEAQLLYYLALQRAKSDGAIPSLQTAKAQLDSLIDIWPGQAIDYYLGKISKSGLLKAATDDDPVKSGNMQCQANFYLGEGELIDGNRDLARKYFQDGIDLCPNDSFEVLSMQAELDRM